MRRIIEEEEEVNARMIGSKDKEKMQNLGKEEEKYCTHKHDI